MRFTRLIRGGALTIAMLALGASSSSAGTLKGTIKSAKKGKKTKISVTTDKGVCGKKALYDESLIVSSSGGLKNAVVSIKKVRKGKKSKPTTIVIDQKGCQYTPHVSATTAGSEVKIVNSDPTLHNVHTYLEGDTLFNLAMPTKGQKTTKELEDSGTVDIKCDVHNWMKAYIRVFDNPYFAVTGKDGSFSIGDLPDGNYKVIIWHEKLGEKTKKVTVKGDATLDFSF